MREGRHAGTIAPQLRRKDTNKSTFAQLLECFWRQCLPAIILRAADVAMKVWLVTVSKPSKRGCIAISSIFPSTRPPGGRYAK